MVLLDKILGMESSSRDFLNLQNYLPEMSPFKSRLLKRIRGKTVRRLLEVGLKFLFDPSMATQTDIMRSPRRLFS